MKFGELSEIKESAPLIIENNLKHTLFSFSKQQIDHPIIVEKAQGVYFYDQNGKRYLDFSSQLVNVNIGHGNSRVKEAIIRQMDAVSYVQPGMVTDIRGQLGKRLSDISPGGDKKTFFTLGGSDAIENAIKLARVYTGRHKIITFYQSYHGSSYGAISASGDPRRFAVDSQAMPNVVHVENPYAYRCPWSCEGIQSCSKKCVDHMARVIQYENPESIAAILVEGESGTSGCIKYPPGYLKDIEELL